MRQALTLLTAIAFVAVTSTAYAGGMNPGIPNSGVKVTGPTVNGLMVVDTHDYHVTMMSPPDITALENKSLVAAIWLQRGGQTASAIFMLPSLFLANFGCDPSRTSARFAYTGANANTLSLWMSPSTMNALFTALGMNLLTAGQPAITAIGNNVCTSDPDNTLPTNPPGVNPVNPSPGILSFQFNIQFVQP